MCYIIHHRINLCNYFLYVWAFQVAPSGKESACQRGRHRDGFNPWVRKVSGEGNGNPLHYSCLENPRDRQPGGLHSKGLQTSWPPLSDWAAAVRVFINSLFISFTEDRILGGRLHLFCLSKHEQEIFIVRFPVQLSPLIYRFSCIHYTSKLGEDFNWMLYS